MTFEQEGTGKNGGRETDVGSQAETWYREQLGREKVTREDRKWGEEGHLSDTTTWKKASMKEGTSGYLRVRLGISGLRKGTGA